MVTSGPLILINPHICISQRSFEGKHTAPPAQPSAAAFFTRVSASLPRDRAISPPALWPSLPQIELVAQVALLQQHFLALQQFLQNDREIQTERFDNLRLRLSQVLGPLLG